MAGSTDVGTGIVYALLSALPVLILLAIIGLQRKRLVRWARAMVG